MSELNNAVLATLAYYDIFDFPLTLIEVHRYLINPARFEKDTIVGDISLHDIDGTLKGLCEEGRAHERNGYYMLSKEREVIYVKRIAYEKIAAQKWKKLLRLAYWFQAVPYIRAMFVSGSMAMHNTDDQSDFDVLTIVKNGRLYTARIFLSLMASMFGARRKRFDLVAPNKFCFNHYLTDQQLRIEHESLYNAQTYVNLRPIYTRGTAFDDFYRENPWLNQYVYHFKPLQGYVRRTVHHSNFLRSIARLVELILNSPLGTILEKILRWYQQRRIASNPMTYSSGGRTIFDNTQLEFHPRSAEKAIIEKYNATVRDMGTFWNYSELDSGLR